MYIIFSEKLKNKDDRGRFQEYFNKNDNESSVKILVNVNTNLDDFLSSVLRDAILFYLRAT